MMFNLSQPLDDGKTDTSAILKNNAKLLRDPFDSKKFSNPSPEILVEWIAPIYSRSSRKRTPREFEKVVVTRAGRLQEYALVSDTMVKQ